MYTYTRKKKSKIEKLEFKNLSDALNEAVKNWAVASHYPHHIADKSGHQIYGHAQLLRYVANKTGIKSFKD